MATIQAGFSEEDERRDGVFKATREIFRQIASIQFNISIGRFNDVDASMEETEGRIRSTLAALGKADPDAREGNINRAIESFTEMRLLQQFFLTGRLVGKGDVQPCNDDEYMAASLGFAQHLARYCVGRACEADVSSIGICKSIVLDLNEKMLEFDFRNGPLRRKYDGLKYVRRKLENITYEMSLLETKREEEQNDGVDSEQALKKRKVQDSSSTSASSSSTVSPSPSSGLLDAATYDDIRVRMEAYDKLREEVIKGSRDVQKLSKQAIFSVHRGKVSDAKAQLKKAEDAAAPLHKVIESNPTLRSGSYGNSLEEWAEAALTIAWAEDQRVMSMAEMSRMHVVPTEYVGALSDFTGEIGRMAVVSAGLRDLEAVRKIHNCIIVIAAAFQQLNVNGKFNKKIEAVNGTMKKLEDVVYELTLVTRGGRDGRERAVEEVEPSREDE